MSSNVVVLLCVAFAAFLATFAGVEYIRRFMIRRQILDIPNQRSSHHIPTPKGGGVAIVVTIITFLTAYLVIGTVDVQNAVIAYLIAAVFLATVSFIDDLEPLSPLIRFGVQAGAAALVIWQSGYWETLYLPILGTVNLPFVGLLITFLWIIGLTNAYNFMDGIDGMAAGQAVIAAAGWFLISLWSGSNLFMVWSAAILAGSVGFLLHNWHPAKIFMGDVGSATLGFTFAVLPLIAREEMMVNNSFELLIVGLLLVWPFVFDPTITIIRRLLKKENILKAHRSHLYQRLIILGRPHQWVTLLYMWLALAFTLIGLALAGNLFPYQGLAWLIMVGGLTIGLYIYVSKAESSVPKPEIGQV